MGPFDYPRGEHAQDEYERSLNEMLEEGEEENG